MRQTIKDASQLQIKLRRNNGIWTPSNADITTLSERVKRERKLATYLYGLSLILSKRSRRCKYPSLDALKCFHEENTTTLTNLLDRQELRPTDFFYMTLVQFLICWARSACSVIRQQIGATIAKLPYTVSALTFVSSPTEDFVRLHSEIATCSCSPQMIRSMQ